LIETWALFAGEHGDAKLEEFPDLLHPNQAGYAKWSAALRPILATLGLLENKP
jgi:lysophospholipase L1-like esterase